MDGRDPIAHRNLAVIETADESTLDGLFDDPALREHLWLRVGPTRALVAPQKVAAVAKYLESRECLVRYCRDLSQ